MFILVFFSRGLKYLKSESLKGDEEEGDLKKISELSQALLMNLALSNFKVKTREFCENFKVHINENYLKN